MMNRRPEPSQLERDVSPEELIRALAKLREIDAVAFEGRVAPLVMHPEEEVRHEALRVLCLQWQLPSYHDTAVRALESDTAEAVRCIAAFGLVATSTAASRDADARLLLETLDASRDAPELARAAYGSLLLLLKRSDIESLDPTADFDPATDVDWDWVCAIRAELSGG